MEAALIAAAVALVVSLFERMSGRRDERKRWEASDRRVVYARFLSEAYDVGVREIQRSKLPGDPARRQLHEEAYDRLLTTYAEVLLVGGNDVAFAARAVLDRCLDYDPKTDDPYSPEDEGRRLAFAEAARLELGHGRLPRGFRWSTRTDPDDPSRWDLPPSPESGPPT